MVSILTRVLTLNILKASASLVGLLVNMSGHSLLVILKQDLIHVHVIMVVQYLCSLSLVTTTSVSQVIMLAALQVSFTHLIHSGMVKVVAHMKHLVVLLLVSHGFTETML